jgi:hypothetical protein
MYLACLLSHVIQATAFLDSQPWGNEACFTADSQDLKLVLDIYRIVSTASTEYLSRQVKRVLLNRGITLDLHLSSDIAFLGIERGPLRAVIARILSDYSSVDPPVSPFLHSPRFRRIIIVKMTMLIAYMERLMDLDVSNTVSSQLMDHLAL